MLNKEILEAFDNCEGTKNPLKTQSILLEGKTAKAKESLDELSAMLFPTTDSNSPSHSRASAYSSSGSGGADSSDNLSPKQKLINEFLKGTGLAKSHLSRIKQATLQVSRVTGLIKNYSIESLADVPTRFSVVGQYMADRGHDCNIVNSVFGMMMGGGKALLESLGIETQFITDLAGKLNGFVELAKKGAEWVNGAIDRFNSLVGDLESFINNIESRIANLEQLVKSTIQAEIDKLKELMIRNLNAMWARNLPGWLQNDCFKSVLSNALSDKVSRLTEELL
jgi:hypothetical protein|nr:MAG TPA: hypothetical protein [Caudoviricetes sp.]DAT11852.1 MAG TPA: hypothetical protein [Herelleviridae sp.]